MKKALIVLFVITALGLTCSAAVPSMSGADVSLDGAILDVKAQIQGASVFLPVRAILETLGYEVNWSDQNGIQSVFVSNNSDCVAINLTRQEIDDNGHTVHAMVYGGHGIVIMAGRMYMDSGLFTAVFPMCSAYDLQSNQVTVQRLLENELTALTEKIVLEKEHLKTVVQYPQVYGFANTDVAARINADLRQKALNALEEGETNAADMAQAIRDGYTGAVGMCETYFDYMVMFNQKGLFSVVLTNYQYAGGAHGSTVQSAFTFDLSTGKALTLGDIMQIGTDYTKVFNDSIRKEIDRRAAAGTLYEFEFSPFKSVGSNPEFYLSNDAFVVFFQEYAYFPYAAGIQEFRVMYAELPDMIKSEFKLWQNTDG